MMVQAEGCIGVCTAFACTHPRQTNYVSLIAAIDDCGTVEYCFSPLPNQFSSVICKEAQSLLKMLRTLSGRVAILFPLRMAWASAPSSPRTRIPKKAGAASVFGSNASPVISPRLLMSLAYSRNREPAMSWC